MRTRVDAVLRDEGRRYAFRFACEDCAHWDRAASGTGAAGVCANGWPERVEKDALVSGDEVAFCKEFELGAGD